MKHETDFFALREIIALKKLDQPADTEVERFLIELHRRQRAGLLARPESAMERALGWLRGLAEGLRPVPTLLGTGAFAALAVACVVAWSPQAQVASSDGAYHLSYSLPTKDAAFAMIPAAFSKMSVGAAKSDNLSFTPAAKPSATRFILSNPRVAYDATAAF